MDLKGRVSVFSIVFKSLLVEARTPEKWVLTGCLARVGCRVSMRRAASHHRHRRRYRFMRAKDLFASSFPMSAALAYHLRASA